MKKVYLDSEMINNLDSFYDEVARKLAGSLGNDFGRNLDAFNDVLRGGFGIHEYGESLELIIQDHIKLITVLGWEQTINYISQKLLHCHPSNLENIKNDLELAKKHQGKTLWEIILEIIQENDNIELKLS